MTDREELRQEYNADRIGAAYSGAEVSVEDGPCEKCGQRPHSWFTSDGYLCSPCAEALAAQAKAGAHAILIERLRKTLMERHADDWDMETISEAAHLCADEVIDLVAETGLVEVLCDPSS